MQVSNTVTLTTQWLQEKMKHLGEVVGFALPVGPYCFRRGNGEALDNSSLSLARLDGWCSNANSAFRSHQRRAAEPNPAARELGCLLAQLPLALHHTGHAGDLPRHRASNSSDSSR